MIDLSKVNQLIDNYFSSTDNSQLIKDLQKYDFLQAREKDIQEKKDILLELIIKYQAYEIKPEAGFTLENAEWKSSFYICLREIFEAGKSLKLSKIMAHEISQLVTPVNRVIGLLSEHNHNECELTKERYHLAPIVASILQKPSCELISRQKSDRCDQFTKDGKLLPQENVVIIDEVMTTGTNIIDAVNYIRKYDESVNVRNAFVFVTRATGKKLEEIENKLKSNQISLHYIIDESELVDALYKRQLITKEQLNKIKQEK